MKLKYLNQTSHINFADLEDGIYYTQDPETEDSGWKTLDHYIYVCNGIFSWSIDFYSDKIFFCVFNKSSNRLISCDKEFFVDFLKTHHSESLSWILFNLNFLKNED